MSDRTRIRRLPERAVDDRATIHRILDEALICHIGLVRDDGPFVVPTIFGRIGDILYFHGSVASGNLRQMREGADVCFTATIVDGIVAARSLFNHSMNYRSVVAFGRTRKVTDPAERDAALHAISDHVMPGRWEDARGPNRTEDLQTAVLAMEIEEVSAKVRTGGVGDEGDDLALEVWAGVVPLRIVAGAPIPDDNLRNDAAIPDYVTGWTR